MSLEGMEIKISLKRVAAVGAKHYNENVLRLAVPVLDGRPGKALI